MFSRIAILILCLLSASLYAQESSFLLKEIKMDAPATAVAVSPDGKQVLFGLNDGTFGILSDSTGEELLLLEENFPKAVNAICYSPKMDYIFVAGGNVIRLFRPDGYQVAQWKQHATTIWTAVLSKDARYAVSAEFNKTFRLWDVYNGEVIENLRGHDDVTLAVAISPDNKYIASGSADKTIKIWDRETLQVINTMNGHSLEIYDLKFSPDGKILASASKDKSIRLWDVATGKLLHLLKGHTNYVMEVAFTPDGRYLLSASADQTIRLWDVESGDEIYSFIEGEGAVLDLALMPDGSAFYSASMDNHLRKWAIDHEIFVLKYFGEPYNEEIAGNHLFDERRKGESKSEYESRMERAEKKRQEIVEKYYTEYMKRFTPVQ